MGAWRRFTKGAGQSLKAAARRVFWAARRFIDSGAAGCFGARGGSMAKAIKPLKALIYKAFSPLRHAKNAPILDTDIGINSPILDTDIGSL